MTMCIVGAIKDGNLSVFEMHYNDAVLDHRKYHQHWLSEWEKYPTDNEYAQEQIAYHKAILDDEGSRDRFEAPHMRMGGCERRAAEAGIWVVDTPEKEDKWFELHVNDKIHDHYLDKSLLVLDFDEKKASIRQDNGLTNWEACLPDGWEFEMIGPADPIYEDPPFNEGASLEGHLVRFLAEARPFLGRDELKEMAQEMDLSLRDVVRFFDDNEVRWQALKDKLFEERSTIG